MNSVYISQTAYDIQMNTGMDLTGSIVLIEYRDPLQNVGSFTPSITNILDGIIKYEIQTGDLKYIGIYTLWAKITNASGKVYISDPVKLQVKEKGQ